MTSKILINATHEEEVRVAIVDGTVLNVLETEILLGKDQEKANIYKARITRIEPSLEAVFVEYRDISGEDAPVPTGGGRHGFLPDREISRIYYKDVVAAEGERVSLRDRLQVGQELIVQVEKESRGNKGAALTTFISLAGCYLVLMPLNPAAGGISRRIEGEERAELREVLGQLRIPEGMGVIVRTAGVGRDISDLQWDLDVLVQQWKAIEKAASERAAPFLIYQESNVVVRAVRDHLRPEITDILIDSPKVFEEVCANVRLMRPDYISRVKLYNDSIPLFSRFQVESQIEMAMQREVRLPSGGTIVIDHTEAMISIDINSAKATKGGDIEETALQTNLEAAEAIARQLRLRDIGGLVVIDFIDMNVVRNQRAVEQRLKEALAVDRARVQVGKISRFGLLEMSRQRLRPSLVAARNVVCPRCLGQGTIRGVELIALHLVRLIEEEAIKDNTAQVILEAPVEVVTYLMNEKRKAITDMERKHHITIVLLPSPHMETPNYDLRRVKKDGSQVAVEDVASYSLTSKPEAPKYHYGENASVGKQSQPAVSNLSVSSAPHRPGLLRRFLTTLLGNDSPAGSEGEVVATGKVQQPQQTQQSQQQQKDGENSRPHNANGNARYNNNRNRNRNRGGNRRNFNNRQQQSQHEEQADNRLQEKENTQLIVASEPSDNIVKSEVVVRTQQIQVAEVIPLPDLSQQDGSVESPNDNVGNQEPGQDKFRKRRHNRRHHYRKSRNNRNKESSEVDNS